MRPIVVIPARLNATRLPNKPMALIGREPMIVHVWRRAMETELGPVLVACDHPSVAECITAAGGRAVLTDPEHPSGTDRIAQALATVDPDRTHDIIVNLQGDLPTVSPHVAREVAALLGRGEAALTTAVALIDDPAEAENPSIVKMVGSPRGERYYRALYFTRVPAPWGAGPFYHHIGLYAWRREAFERFVSLPPSPLERREKLEQLRALEDGMRVEAVLVDDVPLGVDTPDDLARARVALDPDYPQRKAQ